MTWRQLCDLEDLSDDGGTELVVQGRVVAVFLIEGKAVAVDGMCAHQGGPIASGQRDGNCVTCPWHGWQYDLTNGVNLLTGKQMLDSFPTEIRDKAVWIDIDEAR